MKRLTTFVSTIILSLSVLIYIACESADDPVDPGDGAPTPAVASGTVGTAGGTLTSDDGRLSITFPPNALAGPTQIRVAEIDASGTDPVFDGFDGARALSVEPAGLALPVDAEVSYQFPITVTTKPAPVPSPARAGQIAPEEPENIFDVMIALLKDQGNKVLLPNQDVDYDLDLRRIRFHIRICYMGQIVLGRPIQKDNPTDGDNFGVFGTDVRLNTMPVKDEWFEMEYFFWASDAHEFRDGDGGMVMIDPPTLLLESNPRDLEPIESVIDELAGFQRHTFKPKYRPRLSGSLGLDFNIGINLEYNWDLLDLPDQLDPADIGEIEVTLRYNSFALDVDECADPPCDDPPPGGQIDIATGMSGLLDLSVAYTNPTVDPPPTGSGPWLFVTSDSTVQWYRLLQDQQGKITSTEKISELGWIGSIGTIPVAQGSPGSRVRALFLHGELGGGWRTHWNGTDWGAIVLEAGRVTDASAYLGKSDSRGWVWTNGSSVRFAEFDSQTGLFLDTGKTLNAPVFPGSNGGAHTAAVGDDLETVIVVTDGNPADVWWHDRGDRFADALKIGAAGNGAKQIRTANGIWAVSNNGSDSVTLGLWRPTPAVVGGQHSVGPKPVGIDVMGLAGGGAAVVTTSWENNTYTVLVVDASGGLTSRDTQNLPGGCFAQYAIFVPGQVTYIAFSCVGNQAVSLVETTLQAGQ